MSQWLQEGLNHLIFVNCQRLSYWTREAVSMIHACARQIVFVAEKQAISLTLPTGLKVTHIKHFCRLIFPPYINFTHAQEN